MKKLALAALIALAPVSFAMAGDKADKKADASAAPAAAGASSKMIEAPSWDTRQAGQSMDFGGSKSKNAAEK